PVILPRLASVGCGHVQQQHEDLATFDVAQERVAESDVLVRALNETGHVAHGEPAPVRIFHNADLRMERREWVRSNLRPGLGNGAKERGLAGVRIPHEANIRDDTQLEQKIALLARLAGLGETRRLTACGGEISIPQSS